MQQTTQRVLGSALRKTLPGLAALSLLLTLFLWNQGMLSAQPERLRLGNPAPDFSTTAQDGRNFQLSDYKGRPVFLNFLKDATSADSLAVLRSFSGHLAPFDRAGAKVFGVVASGDAATLRAVHTREKLPFPLLLDSGGKLAEQFGLQSHEAGTAVVGPKSTLMYRILAVEPERHAQTLVEVSRCCVDEMIQGRIQKVGQSVGEFSLPNAVTGRMTPLLGPASQKPIAVLFLSVKCPCSNSYNERLKRVWARYKTRGVRFVGVYANTDETAAEIAAHATQNGFDFPVVRDERGLGVAHFKASVTPEVCVLDGSHKLRYRGRPDGAREEKEATTHELPEALDALLAGKKPPAPTPAFGCAITQ
ncbi:MAG: redoxin domain-containing protein [Armatimonas sp.]